MSLYVSEYVFECVCVRTFGSVPSESLGRRSGRSRRRRRFDVGQGSVRHASSSSFWIECDEFLIYTDGDMENV